MPCLQTYQPSLVCTHSIRIRSSISTAKATGKCTIVEMSKSGTKMHKPLHNIGNMCNKHEHVQVKVGV